MYKRFRELWWALAGIAAVTAVWAVAWSQQRAFPVASGLLGHGIGVLGFLLMVGAEVLYTWRKQSTDARMGATVTWLRAHIFMGLVGPYMVLLHTAMRFAGLAGVTMMLTGVVVASGVVGRYIYTAVPRAADLGSRAPADESTPGPRGQAARRGALASWYSFHVPLTLVLFVLAFVHVAAALYFATLQR